VREVLVIAEHVDGVARDVTRELVTAARELDAATVTLAVIGADPTIGAADGVDEILAVPGPAAFSGEYYRFAVGAVIRERRPSVVLAGFTTSSMSWAPALAAREHYGFASDIVALGRNGGTAGARREFYGGKVQADLEFPQAQTTLLLLRPTVWQAAPAGRSPRVSAVDLAPFTGEERERHIEYVAPAAGEVDITTADVIVAIGRGIGEQDNVARFEELAKRLGATLAASRPLVDAGWVRSERQVGQSGKTVKPRVYVALGISGAVQHLAGMKGAATIVAVNEDPDAAIFNVAHYGSAVDLFDVADALEERLA
jgi:electron transfer flavoprotein alpha subunit